MHDALECWVVPLGHKPHSLVSRNPHQYIMFTPVDEITLLILSSILQVQHVNDMKIDLIALD